MISVFLIVCMAILDPTVNANAEDQTMFEYKLEKAFEGRLKKLQSSYYKRFDTEMKLVAETVHEAFESRFNADAKKNHDASKGGEPKFLHNLNKSWQDYINLMAKIYTIKLGYMTQFSKSL